MTATLDNQSQVDHRRQVSNAIDELSEIMYGNNRKNYTGVLDRLANVEKVVAEYQRLKWMLQGALILMGLLTLTNIGALVVLANFLTKALAALP